MMRALLISALLVAAGTSSPVLLGQTTKGSCCAPAPASKGSAKRPAKGGSAKGASDAVAARPMPDVTLLNQNGERVRLRDLVEGKVVAMSFVFTSCTTICPPIGANFSKLVELMGDRAGKDVAMISISIDPVTDVPARLKEWSRKFGAPEGWTLLTGSKRDVDALLKALEVYTPVKENHTPTLMIGGGNGKEWIRANSLASPESLAAIIRGRLVAHSSGDRPGNRPDAPPHDASDKGATLRTPDKSGPAGSGSLRALGAPAATPAVMPVAISAAADRDRDYFTDVKLANQFGEEMRFYTDLLKGKVVVIDVFFAACTGSCPVMNTTMSRLQEHLGDRLGSDVHLISITVDPEHDTPESLGAYAERFGARRGWYFLSGAPSDVRQVLQRLGQGVKSPEEHQTIMLVGNVPTRLWKKVNGLSSVEEIIPIVDGILNDRK